MIITVGSKTCPMRNLIHSMTKINQPIRLESTIASRYPDHQMFYKFPMIKIASIVNRLKFYQTAATGIGIPTVSLLAALDVVSAETAATFAASGIAWCLPIYGIAFFGQNRVGFMYLKDDRTSVKISYTDFWGTRVDIDVDINDIWPLNDLPTTGLNSLYYNLRRYSTSKTLKFNIKYGDIVDPEKFQLVFGDPFLNAKH